MRKGIILLTMSLLLVLFSASPLYLMVQEFYFQQKVHKQFKIENVYHPIDQTTDPFNDLQYNEDGKMKPLPGMKREIELNGKRIWDYDEFISETKISDENQLRRTVSFYNTEISLVDTFTGTNDPDARERSKVQILIQGKNYAEPIQLELRPTHLDNNRYHGYLGMLKITNKSSQEEELVMIQRLFEDSFTTSEEDFKWQLISVNKEGAITTDTFARDQIYLLPYRKDLINKATVSPFALGYKSNLLHYYPTLFFPLLYPFGTISLGIILLVIGWIRMWRK